MRTKLLIAALICVLIPLTSYAIPITGLDRPTNAVKGYSPASSSVLASIILLKGFSITPPSSNPPSITLGKPGQPNSTKTTKTGTLNRKPPLIPPGGGLIDGDFDCPNGGDEFGGYPDGGGQPPTAPVPEPATMLLLGTGLMGVATLRKFF